MKATGNINTYTDVKRLLDLALERGGIRYRLPSKGKAINFRQRIHRFRMLVFEQARNAQLVPGITPTTPYDNIRCRIEDTTVIIDQLELEGEILELETDNVITDLPDPDYAEEMEALQRKLKGEE